MHSRQVHYVMQVVAFFYLTKGALKPELLYCQILVWGLWVGRWTMPWLHSYHLENSCELFVLVTSVHVLAQIPYAESQNCNLFLSYLLVLQEAQVPPYLSLGGSQLSFTLEYMQISEYPPECAQIHISVSSGRFCWEEQNWKTTFPLQRKWLHRRFWLSFFSSIFWAFLVKILIVYVS